MRTRWVLLALLLIPLADALFLVVVADYVGWPVTVALVVLTALVGTLLVRAEGRHTLRRIQRRLAQGDLPTDELMDGALLIAAGAFLLTPGLVTDVIGFLLAVPLSRYPIREALKRGVVRPYFDRTSGGFVTGNVYVGGFPGQDAGPSDGAAGGPFGSDGPGPFGEDGPGPFGGDGPGPFGGARTGQDAAGRASGTDGGDAPAGSGAVDVEPDAYRFEDDDTDDGPGADSRHG